ncbi:MAG: ferrous iron transport protein A [Puniceicoccales bacterium]|nr:ferrous iron transport protein A [Puniceicoccales bacterium]
MVRLDRVRRNGRCRICALRGGGSSLRRLMALSIAIGNRAQVLQNRRFVPLLLRIGDSLVALDRRRARHVWVEVG